MDVRSDPAVAAAPGAAAGPVTLLQRFAARAVALRDGALPPPVVHAAKRCLIDWYAATLPGSREAPATLLEAALAEELGHGGASLIDGRSAPVRAAALINGTASHTVEFDDIYAPAMYHPGSPTIAAALAVGQARGRAGDDLVRAVVAGYEVSARIGTAMGRAHYRHWHNTGTIGTFGAAVAAGVLLGLDRDGLAHALATAATLAAGLQQGFRGDSMSKPLHAGHAAEAGTLAALAAARGVTGARDMLDGEVGMGVAMSDGPDWDEAIAELDSGFAITRITVKNHGCCGHAFAAIDGALALQAAHGVGPEAIETLAVHGYSATVAVTGNQDASTPAAAKFCLPFLVASALVHGSIRLDAYTPERLADPRVRALMARVSVSLDPEIDALFPARRAARVEMQLKDGRALAHVQPHRIGDPDLPLSDAQLEAKYRELAAPVLGADAADRLLAVLWAIDRAPDLGFTRRPGGS